jgi:hypothetical protein
MQRGRALFFGAVVAVAAGFLPASADTTPTGPPPDPCGAASTLSSCEFPRPVCTHAINDIQGDAKPAYVSGEDTSAQTGTGDALDIRAVDLRVRPDYVEAFIGLTAAPDPTQMKVFESTYRYAVTFYDGTKEILLTGEVKNLNPPASLAYPSDSSRYPDGEVGPGSEWAGTTQAIRAPSSSGGLGWLVISTPRAKLEHALGRAVDPTDVFSSISVKTFVEHAQDSRLATSADSTSQTGPQAQLGAFDDSCFGPPHTTTKSLTVPAVAYHHASTLSAVLVDEDAKPLPGKPVTFTIADGKPTTLTATTDDNGLAQVSYGPVAVAAGTYVVTATFPGEGTTLRSSSATGTLKVSAQKTAFAALKVAKPSAKTRLVTATLLDDLNKPVTGARVDWYVNGKKAASATTDKAGRAVFKAGKPGQSVQARYAGQAGRLLPAASKAAKL